MACSGALALHLLPATAPPDASRSRARARASADGRRRPPAVRCCAAGEQGQPPQDAVLKAISQIASSKGRVAQTTNVIMGGTVTDDATDEWLVLDKKVNSYPTVRGFTAIGTGGDDFVQSMVVAVESVIQEPIPEQLSKCWPSLEGSPYSCGGVSAVKQQLLLVAAQQMYHSRSAVVEHLNGQISQKVSSKGKYISVKIGPIRVVSSEQVQAVYNAMKKDERMKFFL